MLRRFIEEMYGQIIKLDWVVVEQEIEKAEEGEKSSVIDSTALVIDDQQKLLPEKTNGVENIL